MSKIVKLVAALLCVQMLYAQGDLHTFSIPNKAEKLSAKDVEKALTSNGFLLGVNSEMNYPFEKQFKQTSFKIFNLLTVQHKEYALELVNKYPQAGVLTPMGVGIYQKKGEDTLHLSLLTAQAQAKILGVDDPLLKQIEKAALNAIKKAFPNATHGYSQKSLPSDEKLLTTYSLELEEDADATDAQMSFEMMLESGFDPYGFVMPSYLDLNELISSKHESIYDFYVTYSICKLEVIYTVAQTRPEAAAFAPCTTMVYKKKGEDEIVVGFPSVYNWMSSARVEDKAAKEVLQKAQDNFESILQNVTQ